MPSCSSTTGSSSIIDSFNRANETPLASPWTNIGPFTTNLVSNQAELAGLSYQKLSPTPGSHSVLTAKIDIGTGATTGYFHYLIVGSSSVGLGCESVFFGGDGTGIRWRAGVPSDSAPGYTTGLHTFTAGDTLEIVMTYVTITAGEAVFDIDFKINGTTVRSVTNEALADHDAFSSGASQNWYCELPVGFQAGGTGPRVAYDDFSAVWS